LIKLKYNLVSQFYKELDHYLNKLITSKKLSQSDTLVLLQLSHYVIHTREKQKKEENQEERDE